MSGRSASVPRLSRQGRTIGPWKDSRMKQLLSASAIPLSIRGLSGTRARGETDAASGRLSLGERRRVRRSSPRSCPRSSLWRGSSHFSSLRRCAMGVLFRALNVPPQLLQREPQKSMRAPPADDFAARAMRAALRLDALYWLAVPKRILAMAAPSAILPRSSPPTLPTRKPVSALLAFVNACNASRRWSPLKPAIADSQAEKSSPLITSPPSIRLRNKLDQQLTL